MCNIRCILTRMSCLILYIRLYYILLFYLPNILLFIVYCLCVCVFGCMQGFFSCVCWLRALFRYVKQDFILSNLVWVPYNVVNFVFFLLWAFIISIKSVLLSDWDASEKCWLLNKSAVWRNVFYVRVCVCVLARNSV